MRGAQDKLVADIPRKTKTATTMTSVVVNLRLGGEPFFSSSEYGISQTTEKKCKAAKEAEDDGKFIHAVKRIAAEDREEGEEEERKWEMRYGQVKLPEDRKLLDSIQVLWVHETCAQISPQVFMDNGGHYYKVLEKRSQHSLPFLFLLFLRSLIILN